MTEKNLQFENFAGDTNLLLADSPTETAPEKLIPVELPKSPATWRTTWGLKTNPTNKGKLVLIQANLEKYFSVPGLKGPVTITEI